MLNICEYPRLFQAFQLKIVAPSLIFSEDCLLHLCCMQKIYKFLTVNNDIYRYIMKITAIPVWHVVLDAVKVELCTLLCRKRAVLSSLHAS